MQTQYGRVWFGVCWQSIQLKASVGVLDTLEEGFNLVALEWSGSVIISICNKDSVFLHFGEPKGFIGEGREKCRIRRQLLSVIEKRVPTCAERHTLPSSAQDKSLWTPTALYFLFTVSGSAT
jgi:hypothetical protein